MHEFIVSRA